MTGPGSAGGAVGGVRTWTVESGQVPPPSAWNGMAQDIDDLGVSMNVRRTTTMSLAANVATVVAWQALGYRTRTGMWASSDPTKVTVPVSGRYLLLAQVRFGATGGSTAGTRDVRVCLNGTDDAATIAAPPGGPVIPASDGTTIALRASVSLTAGDVLYLVAASTVALSQALHTDRGGTHLFLCRIGAPDGTVAFEQLGVDTSTTPSPAAGPAVTTGRRG